MWEQEVYGKSLYLSLNLAVKLNHVKNWYKCVCTEYFLDYITLEKMDMLLSLIFP